METLIYISAKVKYHVSSCGADREMYMPALHEISGVYYGYEHIQVCKFSESEQFLARKWNRRKFSQCDKWVFLFDNRTHLLHFSEHFSLGFLFFTILCKT